MKRSKKAVVRIMMAGMAMGLFSCSFEESHFSPEQVITNALEETDGVTSFYGESEMTFSDNGEEERAIIKEWRSSDGKIRIESENQAGGESSIVVNDGNKITMYLVEKNQAIITEMGEDLFTQPSPKEQTKTLLTMVEDTHTISIEDEEKVANRMTYHLIAKGNEEGALLGDMEMWIDKENWIALKSISTTGDSKVEIVYKKIDFNREIPLDIFTLDLPENVDIQNVDDLNETLEVTLEEAVENVGSPLFYFPEKEGREIAKIEMDELKGEFDRIEINMEYEKDGLPLLTLSIFEPAANLDGGDSTFPGEKTIEIREGKGIITDMENFRTLLWQEEGLTYSIILYDPALTFEALVDWTEDMELVE